MGNFFFSPNINKEFVRPTEQCFHHTESEGLCRWTPPHPKNQIQQNEQEQHSPNNHNHDVCPHNGSGLSLTDPSPGVKPSMYPSSLPLTLGKMPECVFPSFCVRIVCNVTKTRGSSLILITLWQHFSVYFQLVDMVIGLINRVGWLVKIFDSPWLTTCW